LLALLAEVVGRSVTHQVDRALHVQNPLPASEAYAPFVLAGVKVGLALLLATVVWRFLRAHAIVRRLAPHRTAPRVRLRLSLRTWAAAFVGTSICFLIGTDVAAVSEGRWPLLAPWLHTYALPVFAVLAVLVAVAWTAVTSWLAEYERYAEDAVAHALGRLRAPSRPLLRPHAETPPPRRLFGLSFESRPPPLPA
jgi:hypothetical protein